MTVIDRDTSSGQRIITLECALCGAKQGEDFIRFPEHLLHEHDFDDLQIESPLLADSWGHDEEVVEG